MAAVPPLLVLLAIAFAAFLGARRLVAGSRTIDGVELRTPTDDTTTSAEGAVRSVQKAEIVLPKAMLEGMWNTETLERLARTYWSYLTACTLGLIRVYYTPTERYVCLLFRPFKLLTFSAPEYETDADRGIVRWRIQKGLLVAPAGRENDGYLEIDVERLQCDIEGSSRISVEVEIANFYPAVASTLSRFVYANTQSRIHVIVCYGFLKRLARRDLDQSVTGKYRKLRVDETGTPQKERDRVG